MTMADKEKRPDRPKVIKDSTGTWIIERKPERPLRACDLMYPSSTPKEK